MMLTQYFGVEVTVALRRNSRFVNISSDFYTISIKKSDVLWDERIVQRVEV
jgi:hypothetical protein